MRIVVHYPQTKDKIKKLAEKTADVQAMAIKEYLEKTPCPKEQKLKILEQIIQNL